MRRFLRRTPGGLLRIDRTAIKREAGLDGKWLLRTNDDTLTGDDLAAAYKQLVAVERGWRDMEGALRLHPVYHYREDRIRAHVQLCWLALLLIRVIENAACNTWRNIRHQLDRMHLVTLATADGQVAQALGYHRWPAGHPQRTQARRAVTVLRLHHRERHHRLTSAPPDPVVTRPDQARPSLAQVMSNLFLIGCLLSAEVRTWVASPSAARPSGARRSSSR